MTQPKIKTAALEYRSYTWNTTGGTIILSADEADHDYITIQGALTADVTIRFPTATIRQYQLFNKTTGNFKVRVVNASNIGPGAGYILQRGHNTTVLNNGIDMVHLNDDTNSWDGEYGWQDLRGSFIGARLGNGTSAPTWTTIAGGISGYAFSPTTTEDQVWLTFHIPHDYAPGTPIHIHIHWSPTNTDTGTVRWGCEYTVAKGYNQQAFPAPTTIYLEQAGSGTALMHQIIETPIGDAIPATNLEPDSLILMRVFRNSLHTNDTYSAPAFAHEADLHYQSTLNKTTPNKNYPFV